MDSGQQHDDDVLASRVGPDRAAVLRSELEQHGLVAVDAADLRRLVEESAGYRRLAALVDGSDPSPD